jgi:hypothetical protein
MNTDTIEARALRAYFKTAGPADDQPTDPAVVRHDGQTYVVLYNVRGALAVYLERADGSLRRQTVAPAAVFEGLVDA